MTAFVFLDLLESDADVAGKLFLADMQQRPPELDPFADVDINRVGTAAPRAGLPPSAACFHC
jgi:hypothetical protein